LLVCDPYVPQDLGEARLSFGDCIATQMLCHAVLCCVNAVLQSVGEARLLLRDWLVIFTTNYHRNSYMRASAAQLAKLPVRTSSWGWGAAGEIQGL
jgi:hypothetical protein